MPVPTAAAVRGKARGCARARDLGDRIVDLVRDPDVTPSINGDASRSDANASVVEVARGCAGHRDLGDRAAWIIRGPSVARVIDRDATSRSATTGVVRIAHACSGAYDLGNTANLIHDPDVTCTVDGEGNGTTSEAVGITTACAAVAGKVGRRRARTYDLGDGVAAGVRDPGIPCTVDSDSNGIAEVTAAVAKVVGACSGGCNLRNAIAACIHSPDVACGVDGQGWALKAVWVEAKPAAVVDANDPGEGHGGQ